jgi:hypothetical protein
MPVRKSAHLFEVERKSRLVRLRSLVVLLLVVVGALAANASAEAGEAPTVCDGTLTGGPYFGVIVPAGASCNLFGVVVLGDVTAAPGSRLNLTLRSMIDGSVVGDGAFVQIHLSVILGSITIMRAPSDSGGVVVAENTVVDGSISVRESVSTVLVDRNSVLNGDISVTSNFIPPFVDYPSELAVRLNRVVGNVEVSGNTGPGLKRVLSNSITGTLSCLGNEQPFVGGPNSAGSTAGDCF